MLIDKLYRISIQVQNLRATTDGTSVFLAWDALQSSTLKAYNIYYGTTSGQYIQRKTIAGDQNTLTIRNLPAGTTYYFAVRAVSAGDEESAFSQEVGITVGDPSSSTAPMNLGSDSAYQASTNPVRSGTTVPGETGTSSNVALILLLSAVIGTLIASRRQFTITSSQPRS